MIVMRVMVIGLKVLHIVSEVTDDDDDGYNDDENIPQNFPKSFVQIHSVSFIRKMLVPSNPVPLRLKQILSP